MANKDTKTLVQAEAINTLGKLTDPELKPIFEKLNKEVSYGEIRLSITLILKND